MLLGLKKLKMKNLIDDLIYCCLPRAFHLVLSLLCPGSFKTPWNIGLHNSEPVTWQGHHLNTFHSWEHAVRCKANVQDQECKPSLKTGVGANCSCNSKIQHRMVKGLPLFGQSHKKKPKNKNKKKQPTFCTIRCFLFFCLKQSSQDCSFVSGHIRVLCAY